jgi:hypothetical protein
MSTNSQHPPRQSIIPQPVDDGTGEPHDQIEDVATATRCRGIVRIDTSMTSSQGNETPNKLHPMDHKGCICHLRKWQNELPRKRTEFIAVMFTDLDEDVKTVSSLQEMSGKIEEKRHLWERWLKEVEGFGLEGIRKLESEGNGEASSGLEM